jgi:hypothetical protein
MSEIWALRPPDPMATAPQPNQSQTAAVTALIAAVGADAVATGEPARALFGQDVFSRGAPPIAVFTPKCCAQVWPRSHPLARRFCRAAAG